MHPTIASIDRLVSKGRRLLTGASSASCGFAVWLCGVYYNTMEKLGYPKRMLVDRVQKARTHRRGRSSPGIEEFTAVTNFQGGDLRSCTTSSRTSVLQRIRQKSLSANGSTRSSAWARPVEWQSELDQYPAPTAQASEDNLPTRPGTCPRSRDALPRAECPTLLMRSRFKHN